MEAKRDIGQISADDRQPAATGHRRPAKTRPVVRSPRLVRRGWLAELTSAVRSLAGVIGFDAGGLHVARSTDATATLVFDDFLEGLPRDMVAGRIVHVPGTEQEAIHHSAATLLHTDRILFVFSIHEGYVWYLACRSQDMSSNPMVWCPLALALPGGPAFRGSGILHVYRSDGHTAALGFRPGQEPELFIGPTAQMKDFILARGGDGFQDVAEVAGGDSDSDPVPWISRDLTLERLQVNLVKGLGLAGFAVAVFALAALMITHVATLVWEPDLAEARRQTRESSRRLLVEANDALHGTAATSLGRIQSLLDALAPLSGTLTRFEVDQKGQVAWTALVPPVLSAANLLRLRAEARNVEDTGRMLIEGKD